jgi:hypothetical protein
MGLTVRQLERASRSNRGTIVLTVLLCVAMRANNAHL